MRHSALDICNGLKDAHKIQDAEAVDLFLYLGDVTGYEYECIDVLNVLITDTWHEKHEDLARLLGSYGNKESVNYLYEAALLKLNYRDYGDSFSLADKCIRALAGIQCPESIEKLKSLSDSENNMIKNMPGSN